MTEEHIWPKWIRPYTPFNTPAHLRASIEYRGEQETVLHAETERGDPRYLGVYFVCHGCNTGWMSRLQNAAKAPLLAMVRGESRVISEEEQNLIATWVTMSVMTAEHLFPDAIAIPSAERQAFAARPAPLSNWRIWAASTGDSQWQGFHIRGTSSERFPGFDTPVDGAPNVQTTTLAVGKALFHAFSSPSPAQAAGIDMEMANGELQRISPTRGPLQWPPVAIDESQSQHLSTAVFERMDNHFGHAPPRFDPQRLFQLNAGPITTKKLHLGDIEPHAGLLRTPPAGQPLFKIMRAEHLIDAIARGYLYFNRVDGYSDFPGADPHDSEQLPADFAASQAASFASARDWTVADYYNQARGRTYAACFSLENSEHIWRNYANGGAHGKICLVFDFDRLRAMLNKTFAANARLRLSNGEYADQIFSINYGVIGYVDRGFHRANTQYLQNPITYTFIKDESFRPEQELRVALSALGIGRFVLRDQSELQFPSSLEVDFDFRAAFRDGVVSEILCDPDADRTYIQDELGKLGITGIGTAAS